MYRKTDSVAINEKTKMLIYGEKRFKAYAMIENERFCMCFTPRGEKIHLITIFNQHNNKQWRQNYDNI